MMNILAAIVLLFSVSYGSAPTPVTHSTFFDAFSLKHLIDKHRSTFHLGCSKFGSGGAVGSGSGDSKVSHSQKSQSFTCRLNPESRDRFDAAGFIAALEVSVEEEIVKSGARVEERRPAEAGMFAFKYSTDEVIGDVEVRGRRVDGDYIVRADLKERRRQEAE